MSLKQILVILTGGDGDHAALATAVSLADSCDAHLDAVLVEANPEEVVYAADLYQSADEKRTLAAQRRNAAQLAFVLAARMASMPIGGETRVKGATASYWVENGQLGKLVTPLALFADLVVLPPLGSSRQTPLFAAFTDLLATVRCPVLLAADVRHSDIHGPIAVGWDGSLPAARALVGALPLLESRGTVSLLMVQRNVGEDFDTSEALEYLALHGVRAKPQIVPADRGSIGTRLLAASKEMGCALLVLGAYGHNRTIETVFGGVTDDIVSSTSMPVLLAH